MIDFCKNENCPSSNELLEFQIGELTQNRRVEIGRHLGNCEFCSAEVAFYSHYPQEESLFETVEDNAIPTPLFELAEALLKNGSGDSASLNDLLRERDGLVLDAV